ncbi:hypothetical protein ACVIGV_005257 [Rhizobium leguminosarum]
MNRPQTLDQLRLEFSGFIQGGGLVAAPEDYQQGDPYVRRLLVVGADAELRFSRKAEFHRRVAAELLAEKPYNVVAVALANNMARIVWALMTTGRRFEPAALRDLIEDAVIGEVLMVRRRMVEQRSDKSDQWVPLDSALSSLGSDLPTTLGPAA